MSETMRFDADAVKVLAEIAKINGVIKSNEREMRRLAAAAKEGSETATKAYQEQAQKVADLHNQKLTLKKDLDEITGKNKQVGESFSSAFAGIGTAAIQQVQSAITDVIAKQIEFNKELGQTAVEMDRIQKSFQIIAGLDQKQMDKIRPAVVEAARKNAIPLEQAFAAAGELSSRGFATDQIAGGALDEVLKASATVKGADPAQLASSMVALLVARGEERTPENIKKISGMLAGLGDSPLEGPDLAEVAQLGEFTKQRGMSTEETLAAFTVLREQGANSGGESRTALRGILNALSAPTGEQAKALESLGIQKNVDLVGESFGQAIGTLGGALSSKPQEEQNLLLRQIFGAEFSNKAQTLISNQAAYSENIKKAMDPSAAARQLEIATSGPAAAAVRQQIDIGEGKLRQSNEKPGGIVAKLTGNALSVSEAERYMRSAEAVEIGRGDSAASRWIASAMRSTASAVGINPAVPDLFFQGQGFIDQAAGTGARNGQSANQNAVVDELKKVNQNLEDAKNRELNKPRALTLNGNNEGAK